MLAVVEDRALVQTPDEDLLGYATSVRRCLVTANVRDFTRISAAWSMPGRPHAGLIYIVNRVFPNDRAFVGAVVRALDSTIASSQISVRRVSGLPSATAQPGVTLGSSEATTTRAGPFDCGTGQPPDAVTRTGPQDPDRDHVMPGSADMTAYVATVTREGKWWMIRVTRGRPACRLAGRDQCAHPAGSRTETGRGRSPGGRGRGDPWPWRTSRPIGDQFRTVPPRSARHAHQVPARRPLGGRAPQGVVGRYPEVRAK